MTTTQLDTGKGPEMTIYTSITEIADYVTTALGDYADDYNIDAITDEITQWTQATDEAGNILLNNSGYTIKAEYAEDESGVNEAFWAVVEANHKER